MCRAIRLATNRAQTVCFLRLAHGNKFDACTYSWVEGIRRYCAEYGLNLKMNVAQWKFLVGMQPLQALAIKNLVNQEVVETWHKMVSAPVMHLFSPF